MFQIIQKDSIFITSSVRISRPLADPATIARHLSAGHLGRLRQRLESDLKTLFAFYRYGILHHAVRLRWGFLDEFFPVEWQEKGDVGLFDLSRSAAGAGRGLEVVKGRAPSFTDPWSRAVRVAVEQDDQFDPPIIFDPATGEAIMPEDIQAARIV
jgi:hypothetical protein